jgi:hypothetical protein
MLRAMAAADRSRLEPRKALPVALVLVLVGLAGCGSSPETSTSNKTTSASASAPRTVPRITGPSDLLVQKGEIRRVGQNTPYGVLLSWWRDLQSGDVRAAARWYVSSVDTHSLRRQIEELSYPNSLDYKGKHAEPTVALRRSRPKRIEVTKHDGTVRLFTTINGAVFDRSDPTKAVFITQTPTFFELRRQAGAWRLTDNAYLAQAVSVGPRARR